MGASKMPGLRQRNGIWHIEKQVRNYGTLRESTGTRDYEEAERYLIRRLEEIRQASVYGVRPVRSFREAATKYLLDNREMQHIAITAQHLKILDPFIGGLRLDRIHDETLRPFIEYRKKQGMKNKTINLSLQRVRRILNLAARKWRDEFGNTWLQTPPLISMLPLTDARAPYPLAWEEQRLLFSELSAHLQAMALFKVNTGTRDQEVCALRWDWEIQVPELGTSVFLIPREIVKNREERLIVLNRIARSVIEEQRGKHPLYVFPYEGRRLHAMNMNGWRWARDRAAARYKETFGEEAPEGFKNIRVHDLKHTFGRRLRAAGVPLETRKVLLGHKNGDITSHYSAPEIAELLEATNRICEQASGKTPALTLLKVKKSA